MVILYYIYCYILLFLGLIEKKERKRKDRVEGVEGVEGVEAKNKTPRNKKPI